MRVALPLDHGHEFPGPKPLTPSFLRRQPKPRHVGALIVRIGFWGPVDYSYNKEPQNSVGNYFDPFIPLAYLL